jgi:hypothetical protein
MRFRKTSIAVLIGAALATSAPIASAATSPVQQGYSTTAGVVQSQVNSPKHEAQAKTQTQGSSSDLPFTGLDVGLVGAAGAMLLGAGFGIRRLSRTAGTV